MWLNPLMGGNDYRPSQRGMAVALDFVDDVLPGCSLANLEQLARVLSGVHLNRPERRQHPRLPAVEAHSSDPGTGWPEKRSLRKRAALFHRFSPLDELVKLTSPPDRSK